MPGKRHLSWMRIGTRFSADGYYQEIRGIRFRCRSQALFPLIFQQTGQYFGDFLILIDPDHVDAQGTEKFFPDIEIDALVDVQQPPVCGAFRLGHGEGFPLHDGEMARTVAGSGRDIQQAPEVRVGERTADEQAGAVPEGIQLGDVRPSIGIPINLMIILFGKNQGGLFIHIFVGGFRKIPMDVINIQCRRAGNVPLTVDDIVFDVFHGQFPF